MAASWECPSLPMLSLPLKDTAKTTFLGLKPLISAHYEENPDTFSDEIRQLDQLREHSMRPTRDYNGCSLLRRYFAQLHLLRARFPPDSLGQIPVDFAWKDAYNGAEYIQEGLQIEQASVLYNIAALHAQLGSHGKRDTEQEMKEAVTHFQCSAGAFSYLDEHFAINHASRDLSPEFVAFYNSLMLGQAQECLVEKSLKGIGRVKNVTIARLATRVSEFYNRCSSLIEGDTCSVIAKKNKDWGKLLKFKVLYFQAIAHFYQGAHSEELGRYGEMISLTQLTVQRLASISGKPPKGIGDTLKMARQNFSDHVTDKLAIAKRQNEQVYHDSIPQIDTLELISGADLVKPVSFHPTDPKNLGTDIFARLIPMRAHEVASIYSEEKAKLMRSVISSVEEKDEELEQYMRSLNAREVEKIHEGPPTIPDNVLQMHRSQQGRGEEVKKLHSSCQELMAMSRCVEEDFAAIAEMKKSEEMEEELFQSQHGVRPVSQVCAGLWKEMESYHKYNSQASKSNTELKAMFDQHYPNLVLLTSPLASLRASLPKMTLLDTPAEDASESERWQQLLKEVEKMTKQRKTLMSRFREQMSHDDITKNLVGHLGNNQEVFLEDHMKQFKELASVVRQNLAAQDNILIALTEANAKKATTRQTVQEIAQQQKAMFSSLMKSGGYMTLLQTKIQEGIGFYRKLQGSVSRLKKRAEEVCDARRRERHSMERQRKSVTPESPAVPSPAPTPPPSQRHTSPPPPRPPKKAELAGNLLPPPPDQHTLPVSGQPGIQPAGSVLSPDHSSRGLDSAQQANIMTTIPSGNVQGTQGVPSSAHPPTTQLDLQELHRIQMQQKTMMDGLNSPPPGGPPPGEPKPTDESSQLLPPDRLPNQQGHLEFPQDLSSPSQPVPDATQALNSLQMLLQPANHSLVNHSLVNSAGIDPVQPGSDGVNTGGGLVLDPSQAPQRPPKPSHLKAEPLPSPFPSLPPPGGQQNLQLSGPPSSNPIEPPQSNFPGGLPPNEPAPPMPLMGAGLPPQNVPPRATPSPSVPPEGGQIPISLADPQLNIPVGGLPHVSSPSIQQPSPSEGLRNVTMQGSVDISPGANLPLWAAQTNVGGSGQAEMVSNPHTTEPSSSQQYVYISTPEPVSTTTQQAPGQEPLPPQPPSQGGQPMTYVQLAEPVPYYQPNINIQPGEITLTTSSILGPIPSAQAISTSPFAATVPNNAPQFSSIPHTDDVGSAQPFQAVYYEPSAPQLTQGWTAGQPELGTGLAPPSSTPPSVEQVMITSSASVPVQPQYAVPPPQSDTSQPVDAQAAGPTSAESSASSIGVGTTSADLELPTSQPTVNLEAHHEDTQPALQAGPSSESTLQSLALPETQTQPLSTLVGPPPSSVVAPTLPVIGAPTLPNSGTGLTTVSTGIQVPSLDSLATEMIRDLPGVIPLSALTSLSAPLTATDLSVGHLAQQPQLPTLGVVQTQLLQQSIDDQKTVIEMQEVKIAGYQTQVAEHRQQIAQLQQQVNALQQKQDQEKAASSGQQSALMQLLQQQQGMFSQQQSQMHKLSQQDESHRKEYMEVESKFREALRAEQEMKVALQGQILQLAQENQKLNQAVQSQTQVVQTFQLQIQQYSVHIQERDKQLVAFKDQHKQIVDKQEQRNQQKVAQLVQRIQELQLELNRRREGPPSLPQPIQPTVVVSPHPLNRQQSQDFGPATPQANLPPPMQPNIPERARDPPLQHSGSVRGVAPVQPAAIRPINAPQMTPTLEQMRPTEPMTSGLPKIRPLSTQPMQSQSVPPQMQPQSIQLQMRPQAHFSNLPPSATAGSSMTAARLPAQQQQGQSIPGVGGSGSVGGTSGMSKPQAHAQPVAGQVRPPSLPPQPQSPFVSGGQQVPLPPQPSIPPGGALPPHMAMVHPQGGGPRAAPASVAPAMQPQVASPRPASSRPTLQSQMSFPGTNLGPQQGTRMQQQQQQQPAAVFQSPPSSDPRLQQMHPNPQQMVPHSVMQQMVPHSVPQPQQQRQQAAGPQSMPQQMGLTPPAQASGQRFPVQGGPVRPIYPAGPQPTPTGHPQSYGPGAGLPPQFRGHAP